MDKYIRIYKYIASVYITENGKTAMRNSNNRVRFYNYHGIRRVTRVYAMYEIDRFGVPETKVL